MRRFLGVGLALAASLPALGEEESLKFQLESHIDTALFWATALAIVAIVFLFLGLRERWRVGLARTLVEHGKELPPYLMAPSRLRHRGSDLRRGIILLMVGLGVAGYGLLSQHRSHWPLAFIPGLMGIGYLLVHWLEPRPNDSQQQ